MPLDIATHTALGLDRPTPDRVNGRSNADILPALDHPGDAAYHPCPEAGTSEDVPAGTVTAYRDWSESRIYPNTIRDLFVYLPAAQAAQTSSTGRPAFNLIVFNDGVGYLSRRGSVRATRVLDTLHATGEIQPTMALFVNPSRPPGSEPMGLTTGYDAAATQRSLEYDRLTPDYGAFLLEELLPFASREHDVRITDDPDRRTVCGISSGGICAFSVAWFHPDQFHRVLSHCGSFTNIRGGHNYPYLIRTTKRKPIRVLLQSGAHDAQTLFGDWPLANQTMTSALRYAGYDYRFEFGTGGHTLRHGGAIFADSLRWLWRAENVTQTAGDPA